jgi:HEAT repeat protein
MRAAGLLNRSMRSTGVNRFGLPGVIVIGVAFAAIIVAASYTALRAPAPLPAGLEKLARNLRAEAPFYYAFVNRMPARTKAAWMPGWLVQRAGREADLAAERRGQAMRQLGQMGTNAWPAIPVLLKTLGSGNLYTRYAAAQVLARIRADQAPAFEQFRVLLRNKERPADVLTMLLTGRDEYARRYTQAVRRFALLGLAFLGPGARSRLGTMLEIAKTPEEDHEIRAMALGVVYAVGSAGTGCAPVLKQFFEDGEEWPDVRAAAVRALAGVSANDPALQPLLRHALGDSHGLVRIAAAEALWESRVPTAEVLPVLTEALGHKLASVRVASLKALASMGKAARPAATSVRGLLFDEKEPVRLAAKVALAGMGLKSVENDLPP